MKIPDRIYNTYFEQPLSGGSRPPRVAVGPDRQEFTLPTAADLDAAGRDSRAEVLARVGDALRSGEYACEPAQVAEAILSRGMENL